MVGSVKDTATVPIADTYNHHYFFSLLCGWKLFTDERVHNEFRNYFGWNKRFSQCGFPVLKNAFLHNSAFPWKKLISFWSPLKPGSGVGKIHH